MSYGKFLYPSNEISILNKTLAVYLLLRTYTVLFEHLNKVYVKFQNKTWTQNFVVTKGLSNGVSPQAVSCILWKCKLGKARVTLHKFVKEDGCLNALAIRPKARVKVNIFGIKAKIYCN